MPPVKHEPKSPEKVTRSSAVLLPKLTRIITTTAAEPVVPASTVITAPTSGSRAGVEPPIAVSTESKESRVSGDHLDGRGLSDGSEVPDIGANADCGLSGQPDGIGLHPGRGVEPIQRVWVASKIHFCSGKQNPVRGEERPVRGHEGPGKADSNRNDARPAGEEAERYICLPATSLNILMPSSNIRPEVMSLLSEAYGALTLRNGCSWAPAALKNTNKSLMKEKMLAVPPLKIHQIKLHADPQPSTPAAQSRIIRDPVDLAAPKERFVRVTSKTGINILPRPITRQSLRQEPSTYQKPCSLSKKRKAPVEEPPTTKRRHDDEDDENDEEPPSKVRRFLNKENYPPKESILKWAAVAIPGHNEGLPAQ